MLYFLQFLREYQDEQVGALDGEDIDGFVDEESPLFKQVMDQSRKQLKENSEEEDTRIVKWIKDMQQQRGYQKEEKEEVCIFRLLCLEKEVCLTELCMSRYIY